MFALVDCNSCFASCEQIFRPELRDKPVVVLSNNDGVIVARSKEAKALNIPDLQAYFKQKAFLEKNHVTVFSSNYELYGDISSRIMDTLKDYGLIEVYSIDEAFIDFSDLNNFNLRDFSQDIRQRIWKDVRMPVSIGVAQTKTLAKVANYIAKKAPHLQGVCILERPQTIEKALKRIPTNQLWGIGRKLSKSLAYYNIHTAWDLATADPKKLRRYFSVNMEKIIRELNAESCIALEEVKNKERIICSRMFGHKIYELEKLEQSISQYASRACVKLRKQNSLTQAVLVQLMTSRFIETRYANNVVIGLEVPTDDTREIIQAAKRGLNQIFRQGYPYAKAGVGLLNITDRQHYQQDFFARPQKKHSQELMTLFDQLNQQHKGQLFFASDGINETWQITRRLKSPNYTTQWRDIPVIDCH